MPIDFGILLIIAELREPLIPLWAMEWGFEAFIAIWLFCVGAAVGSFLNVVVYRVPRRMNLMHPASHCPRCQTPIRPTDNIPILGWLRLGGRCRTCKLPISPQYVRVELFVALLFLGIAIAEMHGPWRLATRSLPDLRPPRIRLEGLPFWFAYAQHLVLATTLLAAAGIDRAGFRTPKRLFLPVLILGLVGSVCCPPLLRLPAMAEQSLPDWQAGVVEGLIGLGFGMFLGALVGAWWAIGSRFVGWPRFAPTMLFGSIGLMLGWQRTSLLAVGTLAALLPLMIAIRSSRGRLYFAPAALVLLFAIPCLVEFDFAWPEWTKVVTGPPWGLLVATLIAAELLALAIGAVAPKAYCHETISPDPPRVSLPPISPPETVPEAATAAVVNPPREAPPER